MKGTVAYGELKWTFLYILNFEEKYKNHEIYQVAKKFIENNEFKHKEKHTLLEIYCALLFGWKFIVTTLSRWNFCLK